MTPDQIKPGHTYELTSGNHWTVKSFNRYGRSIIITDGEVTAFDTPHNFARYAVRDVTPAPESDQGEKVAQAQSQGASRGDGGRTPLTDLSTIAANLITCQGLPDPDEPYRPLGKRWMREHRLKSVRMGNAIAAAVAEIRKRQKATPPAADAVNAELLDSLKNLVELVRSVEPGVSERIDRARAAIARAEAVQ